MRERLESMARDMAISRAQIMRQLEASSDARLLRTGKARIAQYDSWIAAIDQALAQEALLVEMREALEYMIIWAEAAEYSESFISGLDLSSCWPKERAVLA